MGLKEAEQDNRAEVARFRAERKLRGLKGRAGLQRRKRERGGSSEGYWMGRMMEREEKRRMSEVNEGEEVNV